MAQLVLPAQRLPAIAYTRARQQEMTCKGIQRSLGLTRISAPIGGVGVTEEMVAKFMRQCEAPTARIDVAVDNGDSQAADLCICTVGGRRSQRESVGIQSNMLDMFGQVMNGGTAIVTDQRCCMDRGLLGRPSLLSRLHCTKRSSGSVGCQDLDA